VARDDAKLVGRTLKGDKRAFEELVHRHQTRLMASALHLAGDRETAEDLAQEAFVEAYRALRSLRDRRNFGGWLYGILRNRYRRYVAHRPPTMLSWETDEVPEPAADGPEPPASDIVPLLHRLPLESREVLAARYLNDMSYAESAAMLGTTTGKVRVKCFRAREALRELLARTDSAAAAEGGGLG